MASVIRVLAERAAEKIPLSLHMAITKRDVLGFYYHVVSEEPLPHIRHLYSYKTARMFESDLEYLAANFNLITYEQLAAHFAGGQRLKPRSVILTFDDGLSECFSVARPLLLKYGVPCVFFITTDYIDNRRMVPVHKASLCIDRVLSLEGSALSGAMRSVRDVPGVQLSGRSDLVRWIRSTAAREPSVVDCLCRLLGVDVQGYLDARHPYMSSDEIRRLAADGFTIGAHSVSHRRFGSLTDVEMEEDIVASCRTIAALSGVHQVPFAFPFSADGVSREVLQEIRSKHDSVGLLFDTKGIRPDRDFVINRMRADMPENPDQKGSNLPQRLARAYLGDLVLRLRQS